MRPVYWGKYGYTRVAQVVGRQPEFQFWYVYRRSKVSLMLIHRMLDGGNDYLHGSHQGGGATEVTGDRTDCRFWM
jgi:hypothetical protein